MTLAFVFFCDVWRACGERRTQLYGGGSLFGSERTGEGGGGSIVAMYWASRQIIMFDGTWSETSRAIAVLAFGSVAA